MTDQEIILKTLDDLGISYDHAVHRAMMHMSECLEITEKMNATVCKNLFLTPRSRHVFCLCLTRPDARFNASDISHQAGTARLGFAADQVMAELLHTHPGAVSPMGLIFDTECRVRLLADEGLLQYPKLAFHPCDHTQTVAMKTGDFFEKFLPAVRHAPTFVTIHDFLDE